MFYNLAFFPMILGISSDSTFMQIASSIWKYHSFDRTELAKNQMVSVTLKTLTQWVQKASCVIPTLVQTLVYRYRIKQP